MASKASKSLELTSDQLKPRTKGSNPFLNLLRTLAFGSSLGIALSVFVNLGIMAKDITELLPEGTLETAMKIMKMIMDPNNPVTRANNAVQSVVQVGVNMTDLGIGFGSIVVSFILTVIINIIIPMFLVLRPNGRTASLAATIIGVDALLTTLSTLAATVIISNGQVEISIRNNPITIPEGLANFLGDNFGISPNYNQIKILNRFMKLALPLSISLIVSYVLEVLARSRNRRSAKQQKEMA